MQMPPKDITKRFKLLIGKYLRNVANREESDFIEKYYASFDRKDDYTALLSDDEQQEIQRRILGKLKMEIAQGQRSPVVPLHRRQWVRMAVAAAIIAVIAGTIALLQNRQSSSVKNVVKKTLPAPVNDIAPGKNRAILTLNDGSSIYLDSSANGTITQQGSAQVVKLSNNEIAYRTNKNGSAKVFINTMSTPRGGQYQLTLPDGTKVWLNAASSISYPTAFVEKERKVNITGEVYFEVAKNPAQPFHVVINDQTEIRVTGTHFNVNAYADEGTTNTTLLEGSVIISSNSHEQTLMPGQQAQVKNTILIKNNIDLDAVMAWKNGYFSFNKTELQTVMKQLSRWYDVDVEYEGKIPDMKFWGGINRNSNLSQVIKILEESKVRFRIESKKIIVLSAK